MRKLRLPKFKVKQETETILIIATLISGVMSMLNTLGYLDGTLFSNINEGLWVIALGSGVAIESGIKYMKSRIKRPLSLIGIGFGLTGIFLGLSLAFTGAVPVIFIGTLALFYLISLSIFVAELFT